MARPPRRSWAASGGGTSVNAAACHKDNISHQPVAGRPSTPAPAPGKTHLRRGHGHRHRDGDRPPRRLHREPPESLLSCPGRDLRPWCMDLPGGTLIIGLRDERRSRSRDLEKTLGSTAEAERLEGDPQYLIRAMPAKGNRLAGLLRAHRLLPAAGRPASDRGQKQRDPCVHPPAVPPVLTRWRVRTGTARCGWTV